MKHPITVFLLSTLLLQVIRAEPPPEPPSDEIAQECREYTASNGYGYDNLLPLDEIGILNEQSGFYEVDFSVQSSKVLQILLTTEPNWPGVSGTPYEIQMYNNQVCMVNRNNRMVAKVNRNYILNAAVAVPMRLRVQPSIGLIELQVVGELKPFLRYYESSKSLLRTADTNSVYIAFGTYGTTSAKYVYGCSANRPAKKLSSQIDAVAQECDAGHEAIYRTFVGIADKSDATVALSDIVVEPKAADETLAVRAYASLAMGQQTVSLFLHTTNNELYTDGGPYYRIELGSAYTIWRRDLLVATRRPNANLLADGRRVLVNVVVKKDGMVNIWLGDLESQTLHFMEDFPIDLSYVTFGSGIWSFQHCE